MTSLKKDKERVLRVAEQIILALQEQGHACHFNGQGPRAKKTNTDGWKVRLARLGPGFPSMELWLDRYPAPDRRRFWWGFYATNPKAMPWLMERLPNSLQPRLPVLTKSHYKPVGNRSWLLRKPLTRREFAQPIEERYRVDRFYGIYDSTPASDKIVTWRALDFYTRILSHLYGATPVASDIVCDGVPPRVEQTTFRIVRDTKISQEIKRLYGFRCQVCRKRMEIEPGEFYAEGHHLKPLGGEHQGPDVRGNLLCLCPNHHALFDYFAIPLDPALLKLNRHNLRKSFVDYHNARARRRRIM